MYRGVLMSVVEQYAQAKSRADVEAALEVCTEDFALEFQLTALGTDESRAALEVFFAAFPDYAVSLDGLLTLREGKLASESFFFDLNQMCEQLGLNSEAVAHDLRAVRRELETARLKEAA
jgi:hypothetical protein